MSGPQARVRRTRKVSPTTLHDEIRRLQKIRALLLCIQYAANDEVEFDVADALAVILALMDESLAGVDRLEAAQ